MRNFNEGTGYQNALRDRKISLWVIESEQTEETLNMIKNCCSGYTLISILQERAYEQGVQDWIHQWVNIGISIDFGNYLYTGW